LDAKSKIYVKFPETPVQPPSAANEQEPLQVLVILDLAFMTGVAYAPTTGRFGFLCTYSIERALSGLDIALLPLVPWRCCYND
jgi:hypothetical protein